MATFSAYPWYPGQAAVGQHIVNEPMVVTGPFQKQAGARSWQPSITAPGTVATTGTVYNSTGLDCMVYLQPVTGSITAIKILSSSLSSATSYSPGGTVPVGGILGVPVPGPGGIAVTYSGTLSWVWQPL